MLKELQQILGGGETCVLNFQTLIEFTSFGIFYYMLIY